MSTEYCFATLALGRKYRFYARQLAVDLRFHAPESVLLILTDCPGDFRSHANVIAVKHRQQSILRCYHDKRFVVEKALAQFEGCVFIDSDCRILEPLPSLTNQSLRSGITAPYTEPISEKYESDINDELHVPRKRGISAKQEWEMVQQAAKTFAVTLDKVRFVREVLFAIVRDGSKHLHFIDEWAKLAEYFEMRGLSRGEGTSIGMAATLAGLSLHTDSVLPTSSFYNDHLVASALRAGRGVPQHLQHCHEHRSLLESQVECHLALRRTIAAISRLGMMIRWAGAVMRQGRSTSATRTCTATYFK